MSMQSRIDASARADVVFCQMPYVQLDTPSIALGLLKAELTRAGIAAKVVYSSHHFAAQIGYEAFKKAEQTLNRFVMIWEILFARYAGFQPRLTIEDLLGGARDELRAYFRTVGAPDTSESIVADFHAQWSVLDAGIEPFLSAEVDRILALQPRIVGCSVMMQQRNASFALLKRVKERAPWVKTILGGGICAGAVGQAFADIMPQVDYVFSGEGDSVVAEGYRLLLEGREDELRRRFPEFLYRGGSGAAIRATRDLNAMATPDYTEYFEELAKEGFGRKIVPYLPVEGSRGCWWGEKGRCRFCGLHFCPESLAYREKRPALVWKEITEQAERYGCKHVLLTDCILSRDFIRELPDRTSEPEKLVLFAECKSNLSESDVRRLKRAGFDVLQPGIESLDDSMLELMHKGNRAIKHVELMKFARLYKVKISWNILMGLPGEEKSRYEDMMSLMALLRHLDPPSNVAPMILMRCSVFEEEGERFGIRSIVPQAVYYAMDPNDEAFTRKSAMYLYSPDMPRDMDLVRRMNEATNEWKRAFTAGARLDMFASPGRIRILDARNPFAPPKKLVLEGARAAVYERTREAARVANLHAELDTAFGRETVAEAIAFLDGAGLTAHIGEELIALALPSSGAEGEGT